MVLLTEVVLIEQSVAVRRNSDKKTSANSPFHLYRAHCSIPSMSFQLGSRPGIVISKINLPGFGGVESNESWRGIGKA